MLDSRNLAHVFPAFLYIFKEIIFMAQEAITLYDGIVIMSDILQDRNDVTSFNMCIQELAYLYQHLVA